MFSFFIGWELAEFILCNISITFFIGSYRSTRVSLILDTNFVELILEDDLVLSSIVEL
jgi:hypothetical protein